MCIRDRFAARQGFTNIVHFTDDGISGTCFDRPGFLAMMKEVEAGNVEYREKFGNFSLSWKR